MTNDENDWFSTSHYRDYSRGFWFEAGDTPKTNSDALVKTNMVIECEARYNKSWEETVEQFKQDFLDEVFGGPEDGFEDFNFFEDNDEWDLMLAKAKADADENAKNCCVVTF